MNSNASKELLRGGRNRIERREKWPKNVGRREKKGGGSREEGEKKSWE